MLFFSLRDLSDDDMLAGLKLINKQGEVFGEALQVIVDCHDIAFAGIADAAQRSMLLPLVLREANDFDSAVLFVQCQSGKPRLVRARVIDKNNLPVVANLIKSRARALVKLRERTCAFINGYHQAY
ncbi:hypothetical protein D9M71_365180 [compost metagenome]